jgi:tRNA nucleotidyltransferase/poly(A) polymerase
MALKEILDKIQSKLPADAGDEITSLIADAKREATTVLSDLASANSESKSRREKLSELQAKYDDLESEKAKLTSPEQKAELERLRKIATDHETLIRTQQEQVINTWNEKAKMFNLPDTDKRKPKVEQIKTRFVFPEGDQKLTHEQAQKNLELYEAIALTGIFDGATPVDTGGGNPKPPNPVDQGKTYRSSGEMIADQLYKT